MASFPGAGTAIVPPREVPFMREIPTLLRFHGLNSARIVLFQHNAGTIRGINQRETHSIALQMAPLVDEIRFFHLEISRYGADVFIGKAHVPLPAAACTAALAGMHNISRSLLGGHGINGVLPRVFGQLL